MNINISSVFNKDFEQFSGQTIGSAPIPSTPVIALCYNNNTICMAINTDGKIYRRSLTGGTINGTGACNMNYHY